MRIINVLVLAATLAGCGAPVLRSLPHPNVNYMAAGTAFTAILATLIDPDGWARQVEAARLAAEPIPQAKKMPSVPADVLDRLDVALEEQASIDWE